jgi:negative regulator of flagellin synthesis FlgM
VEIVMTTKIDGPSLPQARSVDAAQGASVARAGGDRSQPITAAPPADSVRLTGEAAGLKQAIEREVGMPASLNVEKINAIRAAIASGTYQVNPQEIANRLMALERQLLG